jgi:hypothetical protein
MKKLTIIFATISSTAFAQTELDKNRNDKLSPKEEAAIQNKIEKPVLAEDKKTKVVEKTFEVKSGTATETKSVVKEKVILKKKRKKVVKKAS